MYIQLEENFLNQIFISQTFAVSWQNFRKLSENQVKISKFPDLFKYEKIFLIFCAPKKVLKNF